MAKVAYRTTLKTKINDEVHKTIDFSHVVILLIDSMEAFTNQDMAVVA